MCKRLGKKRVRHFTRMESQKPEKLEKLPVEKRNLLIEMGPQRQEVKKALRKGELHVRF